MSLENIDGLHGADPGSVSLMEVDAQEPILQFRHRSEPRPGVELTRRETDVLRLIADGLSSKEIAVKLQLSPRTVENHRAKVMRRTGLHSIAHLTLHAIRLGLIEAPECIATGGSGQ